MTGSVTGTAPALRGEASSQRTLATAVSQRGGCTRRATGGVDLRILLAVVLACACTASRGRHDDAATCNGGAACGAAIDDACAGRCAAGTGAHESANPPDAARAEASVDAAPDAAAAPHDAAASDAAAITDGGADGDAEVSSAPICPLQSGDYAADGPYEVTTIDVDLGPVAHHGSAAFWRTTRRHAGCSREAPIAACAASRVPPNGTS